jgi:hypothetical protein
MRLVFGLSLIGVLLSATASFGATDIRLGEAVGVMDLPRVNVVSTDARGLDLVFELPVLAVDEMASKSGDRLRTAAIPGGDLEGNVGDPAIPVFTRFLAIPDRASVSISASREDDQVLEGAALAPMQDEDGSNLTRNPAAYAVDGYDSRPAVVAGAPAIMRDLRLIPLTFRPVQYDPAHQSLKVSGRIRVHVTFNDKNPENPKVSRERPIAPSFDRLYRELVVNYSGPTAGQQTVPGTYLIICPNNTSVTDRLQPLVAWRTRKGMPARLATYAETGNTKESIKAYIQTAYDTWENPPEYVCLVGDAYGGNVICPTWHETLSGYNGEGDHPYTQLEGGDVLPDINIGRLSVIDYDQLQLVVQKIVGYESAPYLTDAGWFQRACLIGDPYDSGYSTVQVQQWIKSRLRAIGFVDANIDTVFSSPFVSRITTAMNRGDVLMSYRGIQGMSGWQNANTNALTNGWKMPFCVVITCDTGSFEQDQTARSEAFLRAGSVGSPKGGIAAIGTSTSGTHTRFNNCIHYGICYGLLYQEQYNLGAALTRGKLEMYLNYQATDPNHVVIWSTWNNLMGDPAVECWTGYPDPLAVTHPSDIAIGANSVSLTVTDGGQPTAGALVCLWKGTETYAVGYTDAQGAIELPVSTPTAGDMLVTVSKHNRYTYQGTIHVASQQRFVAYQASTVSDDNVGQSHGNADGAINPGETIELRVQLKNFGSLTASGVTAALTCDDPYVTITNAQQSYGDIGAGASAWSAGNYVYSVSSGAPNDHVIRFGLDVVSGSNQWHSMLESAVVAADLVSDGMTLYGAGSNGKIDPGETVQISVRLKNNGGAAALLPTATLLSQSEYFDIPDMAGTYSTIAVGATGENTSDTFTIHAAPEAYRGYVGGLKLVLTFSGGTTDTTTLTIPVGDRTTADPTGPDLYGYYAFDDTDVSYPEHPTYNWIELDPSYGGSGATEIVLGDTGDYQDKSRVVDIPFPFTYYGLPYTRATVCSNGWLAMGARTNTEYRNWTIPGAGGPEAMIAGFWDDLYQPSGAKVFQKYDSANHIWIVEWSHMRESGNGYTETFEIILRDPAYWPTETGDGEILFQYSQVQVGDSIDGNATVGIENQTQSDGLLWTFFNRYTPGSATLINNRAIRFVPTEEVLSGVIRGTVVNQSAGGSPILGAKVTVVETGREFTTGGDGTYLGSELQGIYRLRASHPSFAPDTVSNVLVQPGGTSVVDFALRDIAPPLITHTPIATTNDSAGPYVARVQISDFSPVAEATLYYRVNGGTFTSMPLGNQGGGVYIAPIPGQHWYSKIEYYIFARDMANNGVVSPFEAPEVCYVFYVGPTVVLHTDDMEIDRGWTVGAAGDGATSGVWDRCDPNGTIDPFGQPVQPEDDHTLNGTQCWVTGNAVPGAAQDVADVDGGRTTLTSPAFNLHVEGTVILRYYRWFSNNTGNNPGEDPWTVQISNDNGANWRTLETTTTSDRSWKLMEFDLGRLTILTDKMRLRFIATDEGGSSVVEAAVDDISFTVTGIFGADVAGPAADVLRFDLSQNHPNPFNPLTTIRFSLEKSGPASLTIFDVTGRAVRRLLSGTTTAGSHVVVWNGRDDAGRALPSGIYLYRLDQGIESRTRKMILLD